MENTLRQSKWLYYMIYVNWFIAEVFVLCVLKSMFQSTTKNKNQTEWMSTKIDLQAIKQANKWMHTDKTKRTNESAHINIRTDKFTRTNPAVRMWKSWTRRSAEKKETNISIAHREIQQRKRFEAPKIMNQNSI